jgi:hypothetical protein
MYSMYFKNTRSNPFIFFKLKLIFNTDNWLSSLHGNFAFTDLGKTMHKQ